MSLIKPDTNLLYIGQSNILSVEGIDYTKYRIETTLSEIDTAHGKLSVYPRFGKHDTLRIYSKKKLIIQKIFKLVNISDPEVLISGMKDTVIYKEILLEYPRLNTYLPDCLLKFPISIISFELDIQNLRNPILTLKANNNEFSNDMQYEIGLLHSGDILIFKNIRATCPSCTIRRLKNKRIRIE